MKHVTLYGPGTSPNLLVTDEQAEALKDKVMSGENFDMQIQNEQLYVKGAQCWAVSVKEFEDTDHAE